MAVAIGLVIGQAHIYATDSEKLSGAKADLVEEISRIAHRVPFELVTDYHDENTVMVSFIVDEKGEIVQLSVSGRNKDLTEWLEYELKTSTLHADPMLSGVLYKVPVYYKMKL